jgi:hypothetical protein
MNNEVTAQLPPGIAEPCSVEVLHRTIPGDDIKITYWVSEDRPTDDKPYPDARDIISWDKPYYVNVIIEIPDPVRRHLCATLCVDVDADTCGPAPDLQFEEQRVRLDPCGNGEYVIVFELPAGTFEPPGDYPNRCGRVYTLCVTVGSEDLCDPPRPGLIWGHCDNVEIAVHPPVPNP